MAAVLWAAAWEDFGAGDQPPTPIEAFQHAEIIGREIEKDNDISLIEMFWASLRLDHECKLTPRGDVSTVEHFGRCLASMYLGDGTHSWWDDHHDFELEMPYLRGLDLADIVATHELKEAV